MPRSLQGPSAWQRPPPPRPLSPMSRCSMHRRLQRNLPSPLGGWRIPPAPESFRITSLAASFAFVSVRSPPIVASRAQRCLEPALQSAHAASPMIRGTTGRVPCGRLHLSSILLRLHNSLGPPAVADDPPLHLNFPGARASFLLARNARTRTAAQDSLSTRTLCDANRQALPGCVRSPPYELRVRLPHSSQWMSVLSRPLLCLLPG